MGMVGLEYYIKTKGKSIGKTDSEMKARRVATEMANRHKGERFAVFFLGKAIFSKMVPLEENEKK